MLVYVVSIGSVFRGPTEVRIYDSFEKAKKYCKDKFHLAESKWRFNEFTNEHFYYGAPRSRKYMMYDNIFIYGREVL